MEADVFSFIFNIFLLVGVLIALKDRGRVEQLMRKIVQLQTLLDEQTKQIDFLKKKVRTLAPLSPEEELAKKASLIEEVRATVEVSKTSEKGAATDLQDTNLSDTVPELHSDAAQAINPSPDSASLPNTETMPASAVVSSKASSPDRITQSVPAQGQFSIEDLLKGNGIFWLGALVLSIGGVFLAKYSIEAGLLPPSVRVVLGSVFGVALVVVAELVNQYKHKLKVNTPYISAALASGGVITCFAMVLVSFDFYQFISPNIAFALLAVISLITTWLTLRFGPVLAGIGIIGSYSVPALVSTGSNNVVALLVYVFFVSLSAVWVAEYVKQKWVWWQSFTGHFAWFIVAATLVGDSSDFGILILFAIASVYLYVLVGLLGWKLNQALSTALPLKALLMPRKEQAVILLTLFIMAAHLIFYNEFSHLVWASLLMGVLAMLAAYRHSALDSWPWLALAFALFAFSVMSVSTDFSDNLFPFNGKYLFVQLAVLITMAFSLLMTQAFNSRDGYLLLLVVAPIFLYGISYVTSPKQAELYLYPVWAVEMLCIAAVAFVGAAKTPDSKKQVTYLVLANAMLTLSMTMLLSASTLTVALAAQVASMSYLSWKYKVAIPDWIYKLALMVVVTRLTLAPWLADYKDESIFHIHWTLVVYPAVLAIIWFTIKYNPSKPLNAWFRGVFIHVVALLVTTETSYLLIGDYPNFINLSYKEAIFLSLNWLLLSGVYLWRSQLSGTMQKLYQTGAVLLLLLSAVIHLDISLVNNPFIARQFVGEGIFNWTIFQWLLPGVVLTLIARFKLLDSKFNTAIFSVVGAFGFLFINGEIRNYFNEGYLVLSTPMQQAELYSYSIVWLVISTATIFAAQHVNHKHLTNAGFAGLALVILKAFGVDMSHLEGLLRALSFIGLGLCLVGIGWLFQKMQVKAESDSVA